MTKVRRLPAAFGLGGPHAARGEPGGRTLLNGMKVAFDQRVALTPVEVDFVAGAPRRRRPAPPSGSRN